MMSEAAVRPKDGRQVYGDRSECANLPKYQSTCVRVRMIVQSVHLGLIYKIMILKYIFYLAPKNLFYYTIIVFAYNM